MANTVTSSKNVLSKPYGSEAPATSAKCTVGHYVHGVGYDWRFGVPAFLLGIVYIWLITWFSVVLCTKRFSFASLRFFLNQTSAGRAMTTERFNAETHADRGGTNEWAEIRGNEVVRLTRYNTNPKPEGSAPGSSMN
jgi:hypothetical protein